MDGTLMLQAVETSAVVAGVVFGLIQLRQLRVQREVQAGIELLHSLQAPNFAGAILLVHDLPDGLGSEELPRRLGDQFANVMALLAVFESLGPLVARGYVPIEMYSEFYRGATVVCWRKLGRYIEEERKLDWPNLYEWVQWLAEQMAKRGALATDIPAFERFRDWRSSDDYEQLCGR
jgi:hypothetical protein